MLSVARFDVYKNPSTRQRSGVPYLVVMQSDLLDHLPTRLVMPLVVERFNLGALPSRLSPSFRIMGETLYLWPQQTGTVLARMLGEPVASLQTEQARLLDALDAVISGI